MPAVFDNKKLFQARFKTLPFEVEDDTIAGGRRVVTHQYPNAESWDNEDLGRMAETVSVRGYVYGPDVTLQCQRLFDACGSPGPGLLVLPARPPAIARCISVNSTFVSDHMGMVLFDMEFVYERPERAGFRSVIMLAGVLVQVAQSAITAAIGQFARDFNALMRRFSPIGIVPGVARDAAAVTIRLAAEALDEARRSLRFRDRTASAQAEFLIRQLGAEAVTFAYRGSRGSRMDGNVFAADQADVQSGLAAAMAAIFDAFTEGATDAAELTRIMGTLDAFEAQTIPTQFDCRSVRAERALTGEIALLVRRLALLHRAQAAGKVDYGSRSAALEARSDLAAAFALHIELATDPAVGDALSAARDACAALLSQRGAELPSTVMVQTGASLPAAVLATLLYRDAARDAELVERNHMPHPLYMPGDIEAIRP